MAKRNCCSISKRFNCPEARFETYSANRSSCLNLADKYKVPNKTYNLVGADGKSYRSQTKGTFGGHRKDKIYGTLDCKGAARWIAKGFYVKQRVFFADEQTAIAAGYRPCSGCLREKYKEWKAISHEQTRNKSK